MKNTLKILLCAVLMIATMTTLFGCEFPSSSDNTTTAPTNGPEIPPSSGELSYKLNNDGNAYIVTGVGSYEGEQLVIPETYKGLPVTTIGERAFKGCKNYTGLFLSNNLKKIEFEAFYGCSGFTSITIPDSVTSIGVCAFQYCTGAITLTLGKNLKTLSDAAFRYCFRLVEVYNYSSIELEKESCGEGYAGFYALDIYTEPAPTKMWTDDYGFRFYEDGDTCYLLGYKGTETELTLPASCNGKAYDVYTYSFYETNLKSVVIPEVVTDLGDYAFDNCKELTSVTIGNAVTRIGNFTFSDCILLKNIVYGNSLKTIGYNAFEGCLELREFTIPEGVTSIGENVFLRCNYLKYITIPASIQTIGHEAFYASDLRRVYYGGTAEQWENVTLLGSNVKLDPKNVTFYYYSATNPGVKGNYWYYNDQGKVSFWRT